MFSCCCGAKYFLYCAAAATQLCIPSMGFLLFFFFLTVFHHYFPQFPFCFFIYLWCMSCQHKGLQYSCALHSAHFWTENFTAHLAAMHMNAGLFFSICIGFPGKALVAGRQECAAGVASGHQEMLPCWRTPIQSSSKTDQTLARAELISNVGNASV